MRVSEFISTSLLKSQLEVHAKHKAFKLKSNATYSEVLTASFTAVHSASTNYEQKLKMILEDEGFYYITQPVNRVSPEKAMALQIFLLV